MNHGSHGITRKLEGMREAFSELQCFPWLIYGFQFVCQEAITCL